MGRRPSSGDVRAAVERRLGVDPRGLAAFRVSVAIVVCLDLWWRWPHLVAFYTDRGVLPRALLAERFGVPYTLSLHALSGAVWFQAALFGVALVLALALLVGYRTTVATAGSLVLLTSLQFRNPLVLNGGDQLLRWLLLWGLFLPLGGRWSVDALRGGTDDRRRVVSVASAALLAQVVVVYTTNAVFKLRGDAWRRGTAIRYVFELDQLTVLLGDVVARYPALLVALDRVWLVLVSGSVLLVVLTGRARTLLAGAFVAGHLGMALTLRLGPFPLVSIAALVPVLPSRFWDRAETLAARVPTGAADRTGAARSRLAALLRGEGEPYGGVAAGLRPPIAGTLLAAMLVWNAATVGLVALPAPVTTVADPDEKRWDMFAPEPRATDGWFVAPGRLESGGRVDAFNRRPVRWDRPADVARAYPDVRWLRYLLRVRRSPALAAEFAAYLCSRWNAAHDDELVSVAVYFVADRTRLGAPDPTERVSLGRYPCGATDRTGRGTAAGPAG